MVCTTPSNSGDWAVSMHLCCLFRNWWKREEHFHQADEDHPRPWVLWRGQERLHQAGLPEHLHGHAGHDPGHEHVTDPLQVWKEQGRPDCCPSVLSLLLHTDRLRKKVCHTVSQKHAQGLHVSDTDGACSAYSGWRASGNLQRCLVLQSRRRRVLSIYGKCIWC